MTNKKFNFAKGGWLILLCCGIILLSANHSQAVPLTNVDIGWSNVDWNLSINNQTGYYTNYTFSADIVGGGVVGGAAFCVENIGIDSNAFYELVSIPLNNAALNNAALIAGQFFNGNLSNQTAAQIAIWEIVFDGNNGLGDGIVQYNTDVGFFDEIQEILDSYATYILQGPIGLAQSPLGGDPGISQDYLVQAAVPDAGIMWLLGPAFIMLGILGRKKSREYKKTV